MMADDAIYNSAEDRLAWDQQEGESSVHFAWFHTFLMLNESRSLLSAYNAFRAKAGKSQKKPDVSAPWKAAEKKWNWRERAIAWDVQQRLELEKRKAVERLEKEKELDERRFKLQERRIEKLEQMANLPIVTVVTQSADGKQVTVNPAKWTWDTWGRMMRDAMDGDDTEITVKGKNLENGVVAFQSKGVKVLSREELMAIVVAGGLRKSDGANTSDELSTDGTNGNADFPGGSGG